MEKDGSVTETLPQTIKVEIYNQIYNIRGDDNNEYVGLSFDGTLIGRLRFSMTARREHTISSASRLDQDGYYTACVLNYRLRLFTFSLEERYTDLALSTARQIAPLTFTGNQIQFRVGRKFGFAR